MKFLSIRKWAFLLAALVALVASFAFVACGGGDDDDDDSGGTTSGDGGTTAGDSGGNDGAKISTSTGSDEKFVSAICKAGSQFAEAVQKAIADIDADSDPAEIGKAFAKPFEDFSNAFAKASPPKDLKDWHTEAAKQLKAIVAVLKKGEDLEDVFAEDQPFPDPPKDAEERLGKIAAKNKDCTEAGFFND